MGEDDGSKSESRLNQRASARLSQISSHISKPTNEVNTPKQRRRRKGSSGPPADYSDITRQVSKLQEMARTPDNTRRGYVRQKQAGKLWVRERVDQLFDKDSVREVGSISGTVQWDITRSKDKSGAGSETEEPTAFTPSNNVQGFGRLGGRRVCFTADDYSIRAGHADGALWHKTTSMEKLALELKLPMVKLVDGSSGGGSVTTIRQTG